MNKYLLFPKGKRKALTLSYDDGVDTDIYMIELMEKYGIKFTFNLNSGIFNSEEAVRKEGQNHFRLSKSKAKDVYSHPLCEVATHTYTHPKLYNLSNSELMGEILHDRCELERMFGGVIRGHAYPFGHYNDEIVDTWKKAGIVYARTVESHHTFKLPHDWLRWGATCHHNDDRFMELTDKFVNEEVGVCEDGWLFYLWGHTYEFRRDYNWNVIEEFFKEVSHNEDIWYATNLEAFEYVTAWQSLVYSTNGESVYNPTAIDVWLRVNEETVHVPSGKTINI